MGYTCGESIVDPLQMVELCMCLSVADDPAIEIVTPNENNTALLSFLKRKGEHMYHVCYTVLSIDDGINQLAVLGIDTVREVVSPKPAILFDNRLVGFYLVEGIGLVELLEEQKK